MQISTNSAPSPGLPPPLRVLPDMPAVWSNLDASFDDAADLLVKAHAHNGVARDVPIVDLRMYGVGARDGQFVLAPLGGHSPPRPLRSAALSTLCARLGAPADFVRDRLPAPVQLAVLNVLLAQLDRSTGATLRLRDEEVAALVSSRYAPLDPVEFVETLRDVFVEQGILHDVRVKSVASGMTDAMRIIMPSTRVAVRVGDVSALGIDVSTSSFGRSAVHVRAVTWRLVCTNGLRAPESAGSASFRHVGDPARLREGLREAVPTVMARGAGLLEQWQASTAKYVHDLANTIDGLRELTVAERARVRGAVLVEAQTSELPGSIDAYSFINGMTAAAHHAEPARRLELETLAGEFLARRVG